MDPYETDTCEVMKCMPNSHPAALKGVNEVYKFFAQMYNDTRKLGSMNNFVCDFVQDEHGFFYFLKIHEFSMDGKAVNQKDWKVSTEFKKLELFRQ